MTGGSSFLAISLEVIFLAVNQVVFKLNAEKKKKFGSDLACHLYQNLVLIGLFLEGNRRDTAWLLLFSVTRERSHQCGPSARAL